MIKDRAGYDDGVKQPVCTYLRAYLLEKASFSLKAEQLMTEIVIGGGHTARCIVDDAANYITDAVVEMLTHALYDHLVQVS